MRVKSLLEPLEPLDEDDELLLLALLLLALPLLLLLAKVIDPAPLAMDTAVVPESAVEVS